MSEKGRGKGCEGERYGVRGKWIKKGEKRRERERVGEWGEGESLPSSCIECKNHIALLHSPFTPPFSHPLFAYTHF